MKTSLAHLPQRKREEILHVADIIRKQSKYAKMIILFGSFARGDWVEDVYVEDNITYEYKSDYDILAITHSPQIANRYSYWADIARKAGKLPITNHVTLIAHDIEHVNAQLNKGQYFFSDIKKEGIILYDSGKLKLARARQFDIKQRAGDAKDNFEEYFKSTRRFYAAYQFHLDKRWYKHAAFELHQATETFYKTITLVFTNYKPKGHYLDTLGSMATSFDPQFLTVFPQLTEEEKICFDLLQRAYVEARYNKDYRITKKQLEYLGQRVRKLQRLTKKICKEKIESFV